MKISTGGNQMVVVPVVVRRVVVIGSAVCILVTNMGSGMATMVWIKRRKITEYIVIVIVSERRLKKIMSEILQNNPDRFHALIYFFQPAWICLQQSLVITRVIIMAAKNGCLSIRIGNMPSVCAGRPAGGSVTSHFAARFELIMLVNCSVGECSA